MDHIAQWGIRETCTHSMGQVRGLRGRPAQHLDSFLPSALPMLGLSSGDPLVTPPESKPADRGSCGSPVNGADTGDGVIVTDSFSQEPVSDLPSEHGRVLPLVVSDLLHHFGGGHLGLGAPYHSRPDAASLVVPTPIENPKELPNKQVGSLVNDPSQSLTPLGGCWSGGWHPKTALEHLLFLELSVSLTWRGFVAANPDFTPAPLLPFPWARLLCLPQEEPSSGDK